MLQAISIWSAAAKGNAFPRKVCLRKMGPGKVQRWFSTFSHLCFKLLVEHVEAAVKHEIFKTSEYFFVMYD